MDVFDKLPMTVYKPEWREKHIVIKQITWSVEINIYGWNSNQSVTFSLQQNPEHDEVHA